jgi:hypothetical protein
MTAAIEPWLQGQPRLRLSSALVKCEQLAWTCVTGACSESQVSSVQDRRRGHCSSLQCSSSGHMKMR